MSSVPQRIGIELVGVDDSAALRGWEALAVREGFAFVRTDRYAGIFPIAVTSAADRRHDLPSGVVEIIDAGAPPGEGALRAAIQRATVWGEDVRVHGTASLCAAKPGDDVTVRLRPFVDEEVAGAVAYPACLVRGSRLFVPLGLGEQLTLAGSGFYPYGNPAGDDQVQFPLSTVDRNAVCRMMSVIAARACQLAGVPYVRKWYYPDASRGALMARFDVDVIDRSRLRDVLRTCVAHGRHATFFVNASGEEEIEDRAGPRIATDRMSCEWPLLDEIVARGHEVASHGYWHVVFAGAAECQRDVEQSIAALRGIASPIVGYAAPGGVWSPSIASAIRSLGLTYSSEVACAFDGFPFWPDGATLDDPLQMPVSPFMTRTLTLEKSPAQVIAAVADWARRSSERAEPLSIVLHTDDLDRWGPKLFDDVLTIADREALLDFTFAGFTDWWRRRARVEIEAVADGPDVEIRTTAPMPVAIDDRIVFVDQHARVDRCVVA